MLYRINLQHFLVEMIDYFTLDDLVDIQYVIISSKIHNGNRCANIVKMNSLYPLPEMVESYASSGDKDILRKLYFDMMEKGTSEYRHSNSFKVAMYQTIVNPVLNNYDICLMCDKEEDPYLDVVCDYIEKSFSLKTIDLNELFSKGKVGQIKIDKDKVHDKAVDIRRAALKEEYSTMKATDGGRKQLVKIMTKEDKIKELKKLGVKLDQDDKEIIDELLIDEWANEDS